MDLNPRVPITPKAWMESVADGMESMCSIVWHQAAEDSFGTRFAQFHTRLRRNSIPQRVADSIHGYAVIWMRKGNDMAKNLLLEHSEKLACEIAVLCNGHKIDSNTVDHYLSHRPQSA